jgi:F0F1-type ATP synthase assembly protein I
MTQDREPDGRPRADDPERSTGAQLGVYAGLGLQFALAILGAVYLGQWLDRRLGTEPWLLLIGVFVGAGGSFYSIYRKLMADLRRDEERRRR